MVLEYNELKVGDILEVSFIGKGHLFEVMGKSGGTVNEADYTEVRDLLRKNAEGGDVYKIPMPLMASVLDSDPEVHQYHKNKNKNK